MARTGITYSDVANAAQQLQGRGKNPTVDGIRELLGTGSKSTIAQHLRAWKGEQMPDQAVLPQELTALVAGLWEKLNAIADERIMNIEADARHEVSQISDTANALRQELSILSQQKISLDETLLLKEREIDSVSAELLVEQQHNRTLLVQQEAYTSQLDEMKSENQRLHQLASHIQANLEHYQSAVQQLQTEQNLMLEKQQVFYQQQMNDLDAELRIYRQKTSDLENTVQIHQMKAESLQTTLHDQQCVNETLSRNIQETTTALLKSEMQFEQLQVTTTTNQQELTHCKQEHQALLMQQAVTADQCQRLQTLLQHKEDTLEMLRQEKLFLIQENSELKGYLKKLDSKTAVLVHAE